jgi:hypothetical protein
MSAYIAGRTSAAHCPMTQALRTDLNNFLFSPVASDANGMHLTMLSALARSGLDPWEEAARLATLSKESATQSIVRMLAGVPNGPPPGDQTTSMAASLVVQLHSSSAPVLKPVSPAGTAPRDDEAPLLSFSMVPARIRWAIYGLAAMLLMAIVYRTLLAMSG